MIQLTKKYRPKVLRQIVGQPVPSKILYNSIKKNRIHQAYIFHGFLGSGKTSAARIFASIINGNMDPDKPQDITKKQISAIFNGTSIDVKQLDAASNRKIQDARTIKQDASYSPVSGNKKIYIIDEVHMFTKQAFNAMLKLVQQPPPHVMFIFCTTDLNKIPPTIISRCITLNFNTIDWRIISTKLQQIAKLQNRNMQPQAIKIVAKSSAGSMRSALNNLQKVFVFAAGQTITALDAQQCLGVSSDQPYFNIIQGIMTQAPHISMKALNQLMFSGINSDQIIRQIEFHLKNILNIQICQKDLSNFSFSDDQVKRYKHVCRSIRARVIARIIGLLIDVRKGLSVNMDIQALLQAWIINSTVQVSRIPKTDQTNAATK